MKILVGYDGREQAADALRFGALLAELKGAELCVVTALDYDPLPFAIDAYEKALEQHFEDLFNRAAEQLGDVPFERRAVRRSSPAEALNEVAEEEDAAVIVIGSTHRGVLGRVYPGSTGERLLNGAPCPVVIVPKGYASRDHAAIGLVGVGFTGSDTSRGALEYAQQVAADFDAALRLIAVVPPVTALPPVVAGISVDFTDNLRKTLERALAEGKELCRDDLEVETVLLDGDPAAALSAQGVELDVLVVGSRGYGPFARVLLGSVSAEVSRTAPCPVIVVPRTKRRGDE